MHGVLRVVNKKANEIAMRTALAFGCRVNPACRFARKHYYYPDMPKNYQISQYEEPLAEEGRLEIDIDGASRTIGIQRLHLEEDVGKLIHEGTLETAQASLVDFNRSGVPLMETVSKPDLRSPEEAAAYLKAFRAVRRAGVRRRRPHPVASARRLLRGRPARAGAVGGRGPAEDRLQLGHVRAPAGASRGRRARDRDLAHSAAAPRRPAPAHRRWD